MTEADDIIGMQNKKRLALRSLTFDSRPGSENKLFGKAFLSLLLKLIFILLSFSLSVFFTRLSGAEGYGIYSYIVAWANLLAIPATFGLDKLLIREVSIYHTQSKMGLLRGIVEFSNKFVLAVSIGLSFIALMGLFVLHSQGLIEEKIFVPLIIAFISLPFAALRNTRLSTMKGLDKVLLGLLPEQVLAPILTISFAAALFFLFKDDFTPNHLAFAYLLSIAFTFVVGSFLLKRNLSFNVAESKPVFKPASWLKSAPAMALIGGLAIVNSQVDILMLGSLTDASLVGIYVISLRVSEIVRIPLSSINSVFAPKIASLYSSGKTSQLRSMVAKCSYIISIPALASSCFLLLFGNSILALWGRDLEGAYSVLVILVLGQLANASVGSVGFLLTMTGHEKDVSITMALSIAINICLNLILIPIWGIQGAACATASAMVFWNVTMALLVKKKLKINSTVLSAINLGK